VPPAKLLIEEIVNAEESFIPIAIMIPIGADRAKPVNTNMMLQKDWVLCLVRDTPREKAAAVLCRLIAISSYT
jgi:hypothetical protein